MNSKLFIETIKVIDGHFIHLPLHIKRMNETSREVYGIPIGISFPDDLIPPHLQQGIVKCRIEYSDHVHHITFEPYTPRPVNSLKLVEGNHTEYHLKYADRSQLSALTALRGNCDDILIVEQGKITDTSYSNIVLYDGGHYFTPSTYLLNGTQRQYLLAKGYIRETTMTPSDLNYFSHLYLINAMLSLKDHVSVETKNILW